MSDPLIDLDCGTTVQGHTPEKSDGPTDIAIHDLPKAAVVSPKEQMARMFDEMRKQLYVVDCSGSMGAYIMKSLTDPSGESKYIAARRVLRRAVDARYDKYENPDICIIEFGGDAQPQRTQTRSDLEMAIEGIYPHSGSTDITRAVERAVNECKRSPSPVHLHNVILITDGLDYKAACVEQEWVGAMKEKGIVLDIILINTAMTVEEEEESKTDGEYFGLNQQTVFRSLKRACEATGGKFQLVKFGDDLETKFLEATQRLYLPAPEDPAKK